ncbi:MAG: DinB family protein [Gemmatimonadaceae bacterium]|nr:DinB family protein [Gemmatimonadaceae bacterium]
MRRFASAVALPLAVALTGAMAASPQSLAAQGLMADMHSEVSAVQKKLVDLANAIPESAYAWRPGAGVRSVGEVFKHVAADNYLIPIMMGAPAPASTGITASDMKSVGTYEARPLTKAQVVAELEASFAHLHGAMRSTTDSNLSEVLKFFGQDMSRQKVMLLTVTHLHEHLGQSIAYARSNSVVPPWSK